MDNINNIKNNKVEGIYYCIHNCYVGEIYTSEKYNDDSEVTILVKLVGNSWYTFKDDVYIKDATQEELQEINECLPL